MGQSRLVLYVLLYTEYVVNSRVPKVSLQPITASVLVVRDMIVSDRMHTLQMLHRCAMPIAYGY